MGEEERWMLNVVGRKWRPRSVPSSMHNLLIYSQKYVANARKRSYIRTSTRISDLALYSAMRFFTLSLPSPIRLSRTSEICINLGNAREAWNRKFSIIVPSVLTARGIFPCLLRSWAAPREFHPTRRRSVLSGARPRGNRRNGAARRPDSVEDAFYGE